MVLTIPKPGHSKSSLFIVRILNNFYFFIKPSNLFVSTGMCCSVDGAISRLESRAPRWRTWCPTMGRSNVDQIGECNGVWNQNSENRTPSEIGTFLCSDFELFSFQIVCLQPNVQIFCGWSVLGLTWNICLLHYNTTQIRYNTTYYFFSCVTNPLGHVKSTGKFNFGYVCPVFVKAVVQWDSKRENTLIIAQCVLFLVIHTEQISKYFLYYNTG